MTTDAVGGVWTYALDLAARARAARASQTTLAVLGPGPGDRGRRPRPRAIPGLDADRDRPAARLDWPTTPAEIARRRRRARRARRARASADLSSSTARRSPPARASRPRSLGVCHSCLATWWAAVRGGEHARRLPLARRRRTARGLAGLRRARRPEPRLRRGDRARLRAAAPADRPQRPPPAPAAPAARRERQVFTAGRLWDEGKNLAAARRRRRAARRPVFAAGPAAGPNGAAVALAAAQAARRPARAPGCAPGWRARRSSPRPARYEPFGLAVLEAAQAGCALVLADIPTFRELWDGAAVFVPADDAAGASPPRSQALLDAPERAADAAAPRRAPRAGALHARGDGRGHARPSTARCSPAGLRAQRRGGGRVRIVYFTHSLASCWNHGNAHFLRGVLRELIARGHDVTRLRARGRLEPREPPRRPRRGGPRRLPRRLSRAPLRTPSAPASTRPRPAPAPTSSSCTSGTTRRWSPRSARAPATAAASRCSSTTPTTARSATRRRSAPSTSPATTACSPSARRSPRSTAAGAGATASSSGTRPPTPRSSTRPREPQPRAGLVWIGNWGDGERTAELETFLMRAGRGAPACRSTSTACAIPTTALATLAPPRRPLPRLAAERRARRRSSPATSPPCTCRGATTSSSCPASRRSASSRRSPAASRWSAPRGTTPRGCSAPARTSSSPRDGAEMTRHLRRAARRRRPARRARRQRPRDASAPATPARHRVDELLAIVAPPRRAAPLEAAP